MTTLLKAVQQCARSLTASIGPFNPLRHGCAVGRLQYSDDSSFKDYTPEPFHVPPRKYYGLKTKLFTGGTLPRIKDKPVINAPEYKPGNNWSESKALFGQNDYIDILGDGNVHPKDLIKAPLHLIGWKGTELQRYIRQMKFEGTRLRAQEPTRFRDLEKNIRFLMKKWNRRRRRR